MMERYSVFLSSPTDVQLERDRAELVIKRLNAERVDHAQFEIVRWEHEYYRAESDFQAQIPRPADCHVVICIFWKRLGSELPESYARSDGTIPTGTEYEFETALEAAAGRPEKLPDVLVYRKTAEVTFAADKLELERAQYERFMAFWQRWFRNEKGHFLAGFQTFADSDEFEAVLERNLRSWLRDREVAVTWTKGPPYRGLEPFDVEHSPIFFGRRGHVERTRARLLASAMTGKPFLLVTGASGSGKSSLVRAGLIPRLAQLGGLSTLGAALRWAIVTPGQIAGNWAQGMAKALFEKTALGEELSRGDFNSADELKVQFARADRSAALPLLKALERAGEAIAVTEQRSRRPIVTLLVLIDQLEELFTWPKVEVESFLRFLKSLNDSPGSPVWLVATMRSDFQHRLAEYAVLDGLAGRSEIKGPGEAERTLELALPSLADLREMILNPARAAGLSFEVSADGHRDLAELIEGDARPDAMPAIQFLLSELYTRRRGNVLTLEAFDALHGVGGVMAQRGEDVYCAVDTSARQAFPRIVRALVTQVRGDLPPSVRRISEQGFIEDHAAGRMIEALKDARLIISDSGELRFTHDSILKGWKRLQDQIDDEQRMFGARERLEQLCALWVEAGKAGKRPSKLLLQGFQLAEGRELVSKWGAGSLMDKQPELPAYIATSEVRETRVRRITQAIAWTAAVIFALLSLQLYTQWLSAEAARKEAQASLWIANSRSDLRDGKVMPAIDNAFKAFSQLPNETSRSALAAALFELSPHLVATFDVGSDAAEAIAWIGPETVAAVGGGKLRTLAATKPQAAGTTTDWPIPKLTRSQDGNRAAIRAIRVVHSDRLIAVLDNGALALVERRGTSPRVRSPSQPTTLYHTAHASAIGRSGTLVVTANIDGDVALIECATSTGQTSAPECRERRLVGVRGKAVAISPNETRIAVGDESGVVSIYDRSGQRLGEPAAVGGLLLSLGWAEARDWLAIGNAAGDIAVIDVGAPGRPVISKTSLPGYPISTLSWSPKGLELAFACDGRTVCIWPPLALTGGAPYFAPVRRFEGHSNVVTRIGWSPDGEHVASASTDGTIRIWSLNQSMEAGLTLYADASAQLVTVASSPDGRWLAAGAKDGSIRIWESRSASLLRGARSASASEVVSLAWSRSGLLAAAHENAAITVVPVDALQPVREMRIDTNLGTRVTFAEDDRTIAMPQHGDKRIALITASGSGKQAARYLDSIGADHEPWGIAVDLSGKTLFASYTGGEIRIWELASGRQLGAMRYTLSEERDSVGAGSLSVSPDGHWLATSGGDSFVRVYDIPQRTSWRALPLEANEPIAVAFSPDATKLAALGADNRLYIWSLLEDRADRFVVVNSIPNRSVVADADRRQERASWIAWVSNDSIAVATGMSAVSVIGLDPVKWRRRIESIASKQSKP
jgi:WD40 repeat protein